MRNAQEYLKLVRNRGERGLELKRVYRHLQNRDLFLMAYAKLYANDDLKRCYAGRPNPPQWVVRMSEKRRKTLVVCANCHRAIHNGTYDGPKLT